VRLRAAWAVPALVAVAATAGCGGGGGGDRSTSVSAPATAQAPAGQRAAYERRLAAALAPAAGATGIAGEAQRGHSPDANARVFDRARRLYDTADRGVRAIAPPAALVDVHRRIAAALRALASAAGHARDALRLANSAALRSALAALRAEGTRLEGLAGQLQARGY
jgi:hypothetical protein